MPKWSFNSATDEFKCDALYFLQEGEDGPIKIGRGNPRHRVKTLQTGNSRSLKLLGTLENEGYMESFWHRAFRKDALRGEWFAPSPELRRTIRAALNEEELWADEIDPPSFFAVEMYRDLVWLGRSEREAAEQALSTAEIELRTV